MSTGREPEQVEHLGTSTFPHSEKKKKGKSLIIFRQLHFERGIALPPPPPPQYDPLYLSHLDCDARLVGERETD
jgi:hypothetical protein